MTNLLMTAVIALACGALGAMGYAHFFAPGQADPQTSNSHTEAKSIAKASAGKTSGQQSTPTSDGEPANSSSGSGSTSGHELSELKQEITSLGQRIDRLGQQVDRIQTMLSLALPLLQRMAPKN